MRAKKTADSVNPEPRFVVIGKIDDKYWTAIITKRGDNTRIISTEEFDRKFDAGESIMEHVDLDTAIFRVNVDFPTWTVSELDKESTRLGVSRQSLIKIWVTERLDQLAKERKKAV